MTEGYNTHQYSDENQEAAFEFLDHFNQLPATHALAPVKELDESALQCTRTGQVMLDFRDAKPLLDVIRDYYVEHKSQPHKSLRQSFYGTGYAGVAGWKTTKYAGVAPAEKQIAWDNLGSSEFEGITMDRYALHHSGNLVMPLLHIHRAQQKNRRWLLWFTKDGKAGADDWPQIVKQLDAGFDIVTFDFRGLGETRMPYKAVSEDDPSLAQLDYDHAYVNPLSSVLADYVYNSLLTGKPYFLQMIEDAEIAVLFSDAELHASKFSVTTGGDGATLASAIAETLPAIKFLPQPDSQVIPWSDLVLQRRELWPIQYLMPGGAYIQ